MLLRSRWGRAVRSSHRRDGRRHEADHGDLDHRFGVRGPAPVLPCQPSAPSRPGERPLDHPPVGQHPEAFRIRAARHRDDLQALVLRRPADQTRIDHVDVAAVDPDQPDLRKQLPDTGKDQLRPRPVLDRDQVHDRPQHEAAGVHDQPTLATPNALARVVADRLPTLVAAGRLQVEHGRRRPWIPPVRHPDPVAQCVVHPIPRAVRRPGTEPAVGHAPRGEVVRHQPPGAPADQHLQHGVHDRPTREPQRPPTPARVPLRQQRPDHRPLSTRQRRVTGRPARTGTHGGDLRGHLDRRDHHQRVTRRS